MLTKEARADAYRIARDVYENRLTAAKGARDLSSQHQVPNGSAKIRIEVYKHLRTGRLFKRALSAPDVDYFLSGILADDGRFALQTAVQALWEHIAYFERRSGKVGKLRGVAAKHQSLAGTPQFESLSRAPSLPNIPRRDWMSRVVCGAMRCSLVAQLTADVL
jgi:5-methylcytosine-specific restriction protein A